MTKGTILQDYSPQDGFTTWLAFLTTRTQRTQHEMNHAMVTAAFKERFGYTPEDVLYLPGHWRAGPLTEQDKEKTQ